MNKKIWNPIARDTVTQINSTLRMLQDKALIITFNPITNIDYSQHTCQISWRNHSPNRLNSGSAFTRLGQYMYILTNNSYHCLLFDGSLIRVNFQFEDNILLTQNLLWWPAPYNYGELLIEGYSPVELMEDFYGDPKWHEVIRMRSPIRIDFDESNDTTDHPQGHVHIQHYETRLSIKKPICFNRFIDFIFRNFYPEFEVVFSSFDFIDYKIPSYNEISSYNTSELVI